MNIDHRKQKSISFKGLVIFYIAVLAAITLLFILLWNIDFTVLSYLATEEGILEFITALILGISFVLGVIFLVKNRQPNWGFVYFPLLLLSLLAFLDEISYGQRFLDFQTFSIFGIQIDGIHDIMILLRIQIKRTPLFFQLFGLILLGLMLIFFTSMLVKDLVPNWVIYKETYLRWAGLFLITVSFASLVFLLSIPTDSKNIWILGYSPFRIIMMMVFLVLVLLFCWFTLKVWRSEHFSTEIIDHIDSWCATPEKHLLIITLLLIFYLLGGLISMSQYVVSSLSLFYAYAVRLFPFGFWLVLSSAAILFTILVWDKESPKPLSAFFQQLLGFPKKYPTYLFVLVAFIFAISAQLIDIELFRFFGAFLLEEIFELYASVTLLFATLCLGIPFDKSKLDA